MTSGTLAFPPNMYRIFAAWFTSWSIASVMKSTYITSATGRRPVTAAPTARPTIPSSVSGVSRTRSGPNSAISPSVTRKMPPARPQTPTSSPMTNTRLSRRISSMRASRNASE
jgi:hypothetical protein